MSKHVLLHSNLCHFDAEAPSLCIERPGGKEYVTSVVSASSMIILNSVLSYIATSVAMCFSPVFVHLKELDSLKFIFCTGTNATPPPSRRKRNERVVVRLLHSVHRGSDNTVGLTE